MNIATFNGAITQLSQQDGTVMVRLALDGGADVNLPVAMDSATTLTIGQVCTLTLSPVAA